ncbi:MAG: HPr family phosphocarrier protein [Oscillospiraceae bacterium]|nr:HPr family phosphocarrier protein [Oscillospiraceae bacterium]
MTTITHTISDELGLHARPAGAIVKLVKSFPGSIEIGRPEKMVDGKRIMGVMGLMLKQGDTLTITLDGDGEEALAQSLLAFMEAEL